MKMMTQNTNSTTSLALTGHHHHHLHKHHYKHHHKPHHGKRLYPKYPLERTAKNQKVITVIYQSYKAKSQNKGKEKKIIIKKREHHQPDY